MSFLSPEFAYVALLFFPIYWLLAARPLWQKGFLLIANYGLYASWSYSLALFLLVYSCTIWLLGIWVQKSSHPTQGNKLAIGLTLSLSLLFLTKYYDFFRELLTPFFTQAGFPHALPILDIIAPIGISFFTFQAISYLIWKKQDTSSTSLLALLLYLSFWPTLFAGPIMRANHFFEQFNSASFGKPIQASKAIYLLFLGLFQKIVIATWLANTFVDPVFKYPQDYLAMDTLSAILAYALQIFFDFSGYTLIVTGCGLLLGFLLPINFAQPYLAMNLKEFWRRWHISLSTFIRDYVYIPLGGNRRGFLLAQCNIFIAMVISGIWHGAGLGFLVWGMLHGLGLVSANLFSHYLHIRLPKFVSYAGTFIFVSIAWVFFRANSIGNAVDILAQLFTSFGTFKISWLYLWSFFGVFLVLSHFAHGIEQRVTYLFGNLNYWLCIPILCAIAYLLILLAPAGVPSFIYYQF